MKQIILNLFLASVLLSSCANNKNPMQNPTPSASASNGSIVFIQMDTLISQYDMFNDLKSELEARFNDIQNDINKKGRAFENNAKSFQDKIEKGLLTRNQAVAQEQELIREKQELDEFGQQMQIEMAEEEVVMINKVMNSIKEYVDKYNEEKKYSMILTNSNASGTIITADPSLDITNEILILINEEYIKTRQ